MNHSLDDTQPNATLAASLLINEEPDSESGGPGCMVWGVVGLFMLAVAAGTVLMAALAGWNDGYRVATGNATATSVQEIVVQCGMIPQDLAQNAFGLAQVRVNALLQSPAGADCVATLAPQMTAVYSSAMQTQMPAITPSPTAALLVEVTAAATQTLPAPLTPTSSGSFDLAALLAEAQADLSNGNNLRAIDTLDAITAIDPAFQRPLVDQLLFSALTTEARNLYRSGGNLAKAIALTSRAEAFGDVGELNYERFIADLWLQAQAYSGVDYPRAIQLLSRIIYEQGLPNYQNATRELFRQHVGYGDALARSGDPCGAVIQYDTALRLFANGDVSARRASAQATCSAVAPTGTPDPALPTPDVSGGAGGTGVDPIGQRP